MASKGMMSAMRGVYLTVAELSGVNLIVSPSSPSAIGADLLVTDHQCQKILVRASKDKWGAPNSVWHWIEKTAIIDYRDAWARVHARQFASVIQSETVPA